MIHQRTFSTDSFSPNNKHNSTSTTTTTNNNNMLHLNKQININDTNFEEISIPSKKRYSTVSIKQQQYPQQSQFQTPKNYCPSPLQLTRSSSIRSNGSINTILQQQLQQQSPMMVLQLQQQQQQQLVPNTPPSQYIININRTPNNLTPSQRLSLRKSNINNSISQYKSDQTNIFKYKQNPSPPPPPAVLSEQQQQRNSPIIDDADELIDDNVIFNVPFSQSILSLNQHEKFLFDNQSRNMSFVTDDSTRTSSIISHVSINDSVSSIGGATNNDSIEQEEEEEEMHNISTSTIKKGNDTIITNITNEQFSSISKDAQELTVLCNKDEFAQIYDESFQKRKMLSNFKKIQSILPNHGTNTNSGGGGGNGGGTVDSKFYSFTRPTWLPPKSSYEKAKHQKESEDILYNALYQESQLQQKRINELDSTIKQRNLDIKTWERSLLNIKTFQELSFKDITELYWRGISNEIRSNVWWKINLLKKPGKFNESFCDFYFDKYLIIQSKLCHLDKISREGKGSNTTTTNSSRDDDDDDDDDDEQTLLHSKVFDVKLLQWAKLYNQIYKDLMINVYPDANYFQDHQVISKINKIVISVILYLCDQSEATTTTTTTTTNSDVDVFKFYFPGMINLASIYYYNFKNTYKSFVSMCQFYNLRLPSMMITYLNCPNVELQSILKSSLNSYMIYKFEKILKFKLNRISVHFKIHNINSFDYLPQLILSLGLNLFNFEISQRIIDLILFDPNYDEIIINLIINYMMKIQHKLFGNKQEILSALLGGGGRNSSNGTTTTTTTTTNANPSPSSSGNGSSSTVNPKYITGLNTYRYVNVGYEIEFLNSLRELCK